MKLTLKWNLDLRLPTMFIKPFGLSQGSSTLISVTPEIRPIGRSQTMRSAIVIFLIAFAAHTTIAPAAKAAMRTKF